MLIQVANTISVGARLWRSRTDPGDRLETSDAGFPDACGDRLRTLIARVRAHYRMAGLRADQLRPPGERHF